MTVAQAGVLDIRTEMGNLLLRPCEIAIIPRGVYYHVAVHNGPVRGYVLEVFSGHFDLPELGPIGSCGLANVRDFEIPRASRLESIEDTELFSKFNGIVHKTQFRGSIFNVLGWHGTYYPFKYDLGWSLKAP